MASVTSSNHSSDLEDINPTMDLVTFEDVPDHYHSREDLFLIYRLGRNFQPSSRDWIGLYKTGWSSSREYLTYEWAQKEAINEAFPWLRSVLFQLKNVQVLQNGRYCYQFLYVTKHDHIIGVSRDFLITDELPPPTFDLEYVERPLEGFEAFTCIETGETEAKEDAFELVDSKSPRSASPVQGYPQRTCKDTFTLTCDTDPIGLSLLDIWSDSLVNTWEDNQSTDESLPEDTPSESKPMKTVPEDHVTLASSFSLDKQNPFQIVNTSLPVSTSIDKAVVPYHQIVPVYSVAKPEARMKPFFVESTDTAYKKTTDPLSYDVLPLPFDDMLKILVSSINAATDSKQSVAQTTAVSTSDTVVSTPVTEEDSQTTQASRKVCAQCVKKAQKLKALRIKRTKLLHKIADLRKTVTDNKELIEIKDLVLEDMSDQIKALTGENASLQTLVSRPCEHKSKLQQLANRNRELLLEKVQALTKVEDLQTRQAVSDRAKAEAIEVLQLERDELLCQKAKLEEGLASLQAEHKELQCHLDDIMFTLAKQGFRKMVNTKGQDISIDASKGNIINLEDWNLATCRKTERHLATIAAQDETISLLKGHIESKTSQIRVGEEQQDQLKKQVEKSDTELFLLKQNIGELQKKLDSSEEKVQSLASLLMSEKKYRLNLLQRHQDRERQLQESVTSLQDALKSAKLVQQQNHQKFNQDHNGNKIWTGPGPIAVEKTGLRVKHTQGGAAATGHMSKRAWSGTSAPNRGFDAYKLPGSVVTHQPTGRSDSASHSETAPGGPCKEEPKQVGKTLFEKLNLGTFLGEDSDPEEDAANGCGMFTDIFTTAMASLSKATPKLEPRKTEAETVATLASLASKSLSQAETATSSCADINPVITTTSTCGTVSSIPSPPAAMSTGLTTPKKRVVSTKVAKGKKPRKFVFQYCNPHGKSNLMYTPCFFGGRPKSEKKDD